MPFDPLAPDDENAAPPRAPLGRPPRWVLLVLLALALMVRGRVVLSGAANLEADPDSYREVAWQIYRHHTIGLYVGEQGLERVPTATRPPLYPALLALCDLVSVGIGPYGFGFVQALLGMATIAAVWSLGQRMGLAWQTSLIAAGLLTVDPLLLNQSTRLMTETLAALLATLGLLALVRAVDDARLRWALAAGVVLGLAVLGRPTFLAFAVAVLPVFAWQASGARRWLRTAVMAVGLVVTLAPWGARNQYWFGRPVVTTTHGGATLLLANNPFFYEYLRSAPWGSVWDASEFYEDWKPQRDQLPLRQVGGRDVFDEVAIDRLAYDTAWRNIAEQPGMFAYACLVREGRFWNVLPHRTSEDESSARRGQRIAVAIWYTLEFALAAIGVFHLGRKLLRTPWVWGLLLVLSFSAAHTLYWTDMRMRAPLAAVIVLCAAEGLVSLATGRRVANDQAATT
jgi:4-amino-4-deoxy-L-arabinose transferase-like glycosyltransferase